MNANRMRLVHCNPYSPALISAHRNIRRYCVTQSDDRRHFWRAVFHSPVRITTHEHQHFAKLLDISLKGALLEVNGAWTGKTGEECQLRLDLAPGSTITMWCKIMHIKGANVGLRCESIDLDSITHLRRLVELNAGNPEELERELAILVRDA